MNISEIERMARYLRDMDMTEKYPVGAMGVLREGLQAAGLCEVAALLKMLVQRHCDLLCERDRLLDSLHEAARQDYRTEMAWRRQAEESADELAEAREEARNEGLELLCRGVR